MNILNIHISMDKDSYLGLPLLLGRSKSGEFRTIKERIWFRIQCWGGKLLSHVGKAIMIQAVPHAIPCML